jgi:amino acid transporter
MWKSVKRFLVGAPISTAMAHHERINNKTALAVFSSDALSSVAYSTEAILLVLLAAGSVAMGYLPPIVIGLAVLLTILTLSYRQTIHAYPSGGGAYIVAKDNLGTMPGLVAGAALLVDYVLTVAVSISAGVAAITSAAHGTKERC